MPSKDPIKRSNAAKIAAAARWGDNSSEIRDIRSAAAAEAVAAYAARVIADAPPLTLAQREMIRTTFSNLFVDGDL